MVLGPSPAPPYRRCEAHAQALARPTGRVRLRRALARLLAALPWPALEGVEDRVLAVRPDHLGDGLFAFPALRELQGGLEGRMDLLCGPWAHRLYRPQPWAGPLLPVAHPAFARGRRRGNPWWTLLRLARTLRRRRYRAALILRPDDWWSALVCRVAGIPQVWGYGLGDAPPSVLTHRVGWWREHGVRQNLRLVRAFLADRPEPALDLTDVTPTTTPLDPHLPEAGRGRARALLSQMGLLGHPYAVLHPGSGGAAKLWPPERWGEVGRWLRAQGLRVVLTGSPAEAVLTARTAAAIPDVVNLTARTDWWTLGGLMEGAVLALGPDSGPLHLAAALGTPTLHLYGPADPIQFGPWAPAYRVRVLAADLPCRPCGRLQSLPEGLAWAPCLLEIPVAAVLRAAEALLEVTRIDGG